MDDKLDMRNIKTSSSNISGNKYFLVSISKTSQVMLSGGLRNISMQNNNFLIIEIFDKLVCFSFSLCENDGSFIRVVFADQLSY